MSRIDHAAGKILAWKEVMGLFEAERKPCAVEYGDDSGTADLARTVLEKALTLLRDDGPIVPLPPALSPLVVVIDDDGDGSDKIIAPQEAGAALVRKLREAVPAFKTVYIGPKTGDDAARKIVGGVNAGHLAVVALFTRPRGWKGGVITKRSSELFREMLSLPGRSMAAIFGSPYIYNMCGAAKAVMCAYDTSVTAEEVVGDALLGRIPIQGKLPVTLSPALKRGFGLKRQKHDGRP
jgi:hypothetical protein